MPLNPSFTGRSYPPTEPYEVGREKIREFADAIGAGHPAYRDQSAARASGHPDIVAPPTFPIVLSMRANRLVLDDPELGIDEGRVVHGEQKFRYFRPVYAGDTLVCEAGIEELTARGGHEFLLIRTDVRTTQDEPVVTVWSRLVVRGEK
ncbi:MaoC family dehydratase N-terminal domain-containing protein [Catenulispora pinisilvae]|uniref:MaoC family dehydratase N-terminal domain-containing protein n=1 Tax=Catenulispora pinisilvae TaxID=2705253 RepID=UPI001891DF21|nr:MaoC family dehydratase N-terminal domain-containing protein [Catenulispora pinisilvae]